MSIFPTGIYQTLYVNTLKFNNLISSVLFDDFYNISKVNQAEYNILTSENIIEVVYDGASTLNLPLITTVKKKYIIIDKNGTAGSNYITVTTSGTNTIQGEPSVLINENYMSLSIYSDTSSKTWVIY
jgi:hypothetical protein